MAAYYNEIDPYAAAWLRNLIAAGHIAPGDVDERSIEDVRPSDLIGYTQCHFFAGIGVWAYALRRAGWTDDRPVWTGSCPCQPFSAAGAGAGFADERHLWPAFFHLIEQCRPAIVLGEQVASKDADPWIDLVCDDLEALGYAVGAVPFPSAGVGAPHIRDRLYWVADAGSTRAGRDAGAALGPQTRVRRARGEDGRDGRNASISGSAVRRLDDTDHAPLEGFGRGHQAAGGRIASLGSVAATSEFGGLAEHDRERFFAASERTLHDAEYHPESCRGVGRLADPLLQQRPNGQPRVGHVDDSSGRQQGAAEASGFCLDLRAGPTNGLWRDADWLFCRDGKWRPVEPGTFPLVDGAPARVGRLRAYGNAVNAEAARVFIESVVEARLFT